MPAAPSLPPAPMRYFFVVDADEALLLSAPLVPLVPLLSRVVPALPDVSLDCRAMFSCFSFLLAR